MFKFAPIVFQIIGVAVGAAAGLVLKYNFAADVSHAAAGESAASEASGHGETEEKHEKKDGEAKAKKKKKDKQKSNGHGEHGSDKSDSAYGYVKFSRQFIVPVVNANGVNSLFVLDISLEIDSARAEDAYAKEPKLRDALLSALLRLSNDGAFSNQFLREENIEKIRGDLLGAAQPILGGYVNDVLILSISRQDL